MRANVEEWNTYPKEYFIINTYMFIYNIIKLSQHHPNTVTHYEFTIILLLYKLLYTW